MNYPSMEPPVSTRDHQTTIDAPLIYSGVHTHSEKMADVAMDEGNTVALILAVSCFKKVKFQERLSQMQE